MAVAAGRGGSSAPPGSTSTLADPRRPDDMTDDAFRDAMTRLAVDPAFRAELDGDTDEVARRLGLTPGQVTELRSLRVESGTAEGPAALDARLSKSSLFF